MKFGDHWSTAWLLCKVQSITKQYQILTSTNNMQDSFFKRSFDCITCINKLLPSGDILYDQNFVNVLLVIIM